jgi:hypothetical protein
MAGRGARGGQGTGRGTSPRGRNPDRVMSRPTRIPDGGGAPAPNNPGMRPLQQPVPEAGPSAPPSAPPLPVPLGPTGPLPNNPRGR